MKEELLAQENYFILFYQIGPYDDDDGNGEENKRQCKRNAKMMHQTLSYSQSYM